MTTVLVTGYAGFIGSHLTEALLNDGFKVIGIDNFNSFYDPEIKKMNTAGFKDHSSFQGFDLDLINSKELADVLSGKEIDVVIHLAASAGVRPSMENPVSYASNNITAMVSLLDAIKVNNIQKLIFASSSSVYGGITEIPFTEDMTLDKVMSTYAASKLSGETFNQLYHDTYGLSVINLRFFTVYGPRQRPDLAIHKFFKMLKKNDEITLYGKGLLKRDYTYIEDTVQGIKGALKRIIESPVLIETYNLGNNTPVTTLELVKEMENVSGLKANIKFAPTPIGDVPITYANIDKAKKHLDYHPKTDLATGLTNFWKWLNQKEYEKDPAH